MFSPPPPSVPSYLYAPSISPVSISSLPYKVQSCKFAPVNPTLVSQPERLLAIGSHRGQENSLALYSLNTDSDIDERNTAEDNSGSPALDEERLSECCGAIDIRGDLNELAWVDSQLLATASSHGHVSLIKIRQQETSEKQQQQTSVIPQYDMNIQHVWKLSSSSMNTLDVQSVGHPIIVSAGDSTAVHLLDAETQQIIQSSLYAATSSIYQVKFAGAHTIYAAGNQGRLRIWDDRQKLLPTTQTAIDPHSSALISLDVHPSRLDTLFTGSNNGVFSAWDLRTQSAPVFSSVDPDTAILSVSCLPFDPTTILTARADGALCAYDFNRQRRDPTLVSYQQPRRMEAPSTAASTSESITPFLLHRCNASIHAIDVDRSSHTIIAGTDAMALIHFTYLLS